MAKQNCWEVKRCGRQQGGDKANELGVCPATIAVFTNGVNEGKNAGRYCWAIVGTLCGGKVQGEFAEKRVSCMTCEFFLQVKREQAEHFVFDTTKTHV